MRTHCQTTFSVFYYLQWTNLKWFFGTDSVYTMINALPFREIKIENYTQKKCSVIELQSSSSFNVSVEYISKIVECIRKNSRKFLQPSCKIKGKGAETKPELCDKLSLNFQVAPSSRSIPFFRCRNGGDLQEFISLYSLGKSDTDRLFHLDHLKFSSLQKGAIKIVT